MVSVADFAKLAEATQKAAREKNKNLKVDPSEDTKPAKLHHVWAECMGELGEYVPRMSGEEGGMLKKFIEKCPPGTARVLVAFAVREWASFASVLRQKYGVYKVSETPQLGVLVKHADALVTYWMAKEKAKAAKAAQKPVQAAKAVSALPLPPEGAKPAQQQKSGQSVNVKDPTTDPTSHLFKFNLCLETYGLEWAKVDGEVWNSLPEGFAIDCTGTPTDLPGPIGAKRSGEINWQ